MTTKTNQTDPAPLYLRYRGQLKPQNAYVTIDPRDGEFTVGVDPEIGGGVPMSVWHGLALRVPAPNCLRAEYVDAYVQAVREIVAPALVGFDARWDGSNYVGYWPNWTDETDQQLDALYESWREGICCWQVWDVDDWLQQSVDELRDSNADNLYHEALSQGIYIDGGADAIKDYIAQRIEEQDAND